MSLLYECVIVNSLINDVRQGPLFFVWILLLLQVIFTAVLHRDVPKEVSLFSFCFRNLKNLACFFVLQIKSS